MSGLLAWAFLSLELVMLAAHRLASLLLLIRLLRLVTKVEGHALLLVNAAAIHHRRRTGTLVGDAAHSLVHHGNGRSSLLRRVPETAKRHHVLLRQ